MTIKDIRLLIDKSVSAWVDDYAPSMGAAIAYYTLFSMAPLLILIIAVAGLLFGPEAAQGQIVAQLEGRIGKEAAAVAEDLLKSVNRPTAGAIATLVSIVTLLIGATSVFGELQSALNRIWRVPDPPSRSGIAYLLRARLLSFGMVLGLGFLVLVSLILSTALSAVGEWSRGWFSDWHTILQLANFLISFVVSTALFAMIYKVMPQARIAWRDVGIGASVTALLFESGKLLIGLYLGSGTLGSSFGAAGSLVIFLVWVYFSAQIFLLGAEFTWVYSHQRGSRSSRYAPVAPLVPSRSGETTAAAKAESTLAPVEAFPLTSRYAGVAARRFKQGVSGTKRFIRRKPVVSLGIVTVVGVIAAVLLRRPARKAERDDKGKTRLDRTGNGGGL